MKSPAYPPAWFASVRRQLAFHDERRKHVHTDPTLSHEARAIHLTYHDKIIAWLQEQLAGLQGR